MDGAAVNMVTKCCFNVGSTPKRDNFVSWFDPGQSWTRMQSESPYGRREFDSWQIPGQAAASGTTVIS